MFQKSDKIIFIQTDVRFVAQSETFHMSIFNVHISMFTENFENFADCATKRTSV